MEEKFGAVVIAGITIFGLAFVIGNSGTGDGFITSQDEVDSMVLFEESVGQVGESQGDFRKIEFEDFTVGKTRDSVRGYFKSRASVSDSLRSGEKLRFSYNATSPKEANVTLNVLGTEGDGSLYLKANGEKVTETPLVTGAAPKITIPQKYMKTGYNSFELGVKRSGILGSSEYLLEDIELYVNDRRFSDHVENFELFDYELEDYSGSKLQFDITKSIKNQPLEIFVNDQRVYSKKQVRISPEEVDVNPSNAGLSPGNNRISFRTGQESLYQIENAHVNMRYVGSVESDRVVMDFSLNDSQKRFMEREDTQERIEMTYQNLLPSSNDVRVHVNDFNETLTLQRGKNEAEIDLPEDAVEDPTRIDIIDIGEEGNYKLENFKIVSEKVEE